MLTTQHHPNMGTVGEQRKTRILVGGLEPFWMKGCPTPLCLLIGGPCPCPHPMEPPLTPPGGINPQSSTPIADFLVMNDKEPNLLLHAVVLRLPHGPDNATPTRALWQVPWDSVLIHHHRTTPALVHHHPITLIPSLITPTPRESHPDL